MRTEAKKEYKQNICNILEIEQRTRDSFCSFSIYTLHINSTISSYIYLFIFHSPENVFNLTLSYVFFFINNQT